MYKLMIVDDEEIEREGMAAFIPWENYGIELAGTAWNGVEGLEKLEQLRPDIVLVDVKMPVMDGIEMIRRARQTYPDIVFVVLSGYGDYEFTSRAMEEGVRHYLLKPCDEGKIVAVLEKVKAELAQARAHAAQWEELENSAHTLLPRAQEQVFRDLLLGRALPAAASTQQFMDGLGGAARAVFVVGFSIAKGFDYLEQFVIGNILTDLLPEGTLLLTASVQKNVLALADAAANDTLDAAVRRLKKEFLRFETMPLLAAASEVGTLDALNTMYGSVQSLLTLEKASAAEGVLRVGSAEALPGDAALLFDYRAIGAAERYEAVLFELYLTFTKMALLNYTDAQKQESCRLAWRLSAPEAAQQPVPDTWEALADALAEQQGVAFGPDKEGRRSREILLTVYRHLGEPGVSLQTLTANDLYMNPDYLGRLFTRLTGQRFPTFVENRRIDAARRLLHFRPDLPIHQLAELVGYPPDVQYFSKAFRKRCGKMPSEYRGSLQ